MWGWGGVGGGAPAAAPPLPRHRAAAQIRLPPSPWSDLPRPALGDVAQGVCTLLYRGPAPIGYGLRAAVRDQFSDIVEVLMVDPDTGEPIKFQ